MPMSRFKWFLLTFVVSFVTIFTLYVVRSYHGVPYILDGDLIAGLKNTAAWALAAACWKWFWWKKPTVGHAWLYVFLATLVCSLKVYAVLS